MEPIILSNSDARSLVRLLEKNREFIKSNSIKSSHLNQARMCGVFIKKINKKCSTKSN